MKQLLLLFVLLGFVPGPAHAVPWTITVSGTVYSDGPYGSPDQTGLFGTPGVSLVGDAYTETITTDPLLNTYFTETTPSFHTTYGGAGIGGCCGATYTITTTINGITYTQSEPNPFINGSYLIDGLAVGLTSQDQVYQGLEASGCSSGYGPCTSSSILAYSTLIPFVPSLDFGQSFTASSELDPGSNTYFLFRNGPTEQGSVDQYTQIYGSISTISVNPVPEPNSLLLLMSGLASLLLLLTSTAHMRKKRTCSRVPYAS